MLNMKRLFTNNFLCNLSKGFLTKNNHFSFSQIITYNSDILLRNKLLSLNSLNVIEENNKRINDILHSNSQKNIEIQANESQQKIELKNKSRKVAERKRKKRKTGKDIRIRWR